RLDPPAVLPDMRAGRLLRQFAWKARHRPPPRDRPPVGPLVRTGRELVVVLRRPHRLRGGGGSGGVVRLTVGCQLRSSNGTSATTIWFPPPSLASYSATSASPTALAG